MSITITETSEEVIDRRPSFAPDITSEMKSILLIILSVSGNFVGETLGCSTRQIISDRMHIKHLIVFFLIYFTINFSSDTMPDPYESFKTTIKIWLGYILFTSQTPTTLAISFLLFVCTYVTDNYVQFYNERASIMYDHIRHSSDNRELPDTYEEFSSNGYGLKIDDTEESTGDRVTEYINSMREYEEKREKVKTYRSYLTILTIGSLVVGCGLNIRRKYLEYGDRFSIFKFFMGNASC